MLRAELAQDFNLASKVEANVRPRRTFRVSPLKTERGESDRAGAGEEPAVSSRQK